MKISEAQISQNARHAYAKIFERRESLDFWRGLPPSPPQQTAGNPDTALSRNAAIVTLSAAARQTPSSPVAASNALPESDVPTEDEKLRTIRLILEMLTGKKIRLGTFSPKTPADSPAPTPSSSQETPPRQGWGLIYDLRERYSEQEGLQYEARGEIMTADGKTHRFSLRFDVSREMTTETAIHTRAGDALLVDPLVINLSGGSAGFSDTTIAFDLNLDGTAENIPFLTAGSGFLFFDRNADNIANDGSELFGPATGNGFQELQQFDHDRNGWLDENDPLFAELKIWMQDAVGKDHFAPLAQSGIGALYLGSVESPFSLKNQGNGVVAQIKGTSFFLRDNGTPGTMQEIDIAV